MKRIKSGILIVIFGAVLFSGCSQMSWDYFFDSENKVRMRYPQDWTVNTEVEGSVAAFSAPFKGEGDRFQENISLIIEDLSKDKRTPEEFGKSIVKHLKIIFPMVEILDSSAANLGRYKGEKVIYEIKGSYLKLKFLQVWILRNNKAYIITYSAETKNYDEYYKTVKKVLKSFEIIK